MNNNNRFKFRVWDKKEKVFINDEDFCIHRGNPIQVYNHVGDGYYQKDLATNENGTGEFIEEEWVVQQWTGLEDKNGKEIYEGDIVKLGWSTTDVQWSGLKAVVVWWHNGFYLETTTSKCLAQDIYYQFQKCEIIGNIFENKELLK